MKKLSNLLTLLIILYSAAASAQCTASITINNNPSCNGSADGTVTAIGANGTSPYVYVWDVATGNQTGNTATGLAAGTYCVTITDFVGCTATTCTNLTQPTAMTAFIISSTNASCFGASNGMAQIGANGGVGAYTFQWSNGQTTSVGWALSAGVHCGTVTDANGCTATTCVNIANGSPLIVTAIVSSNVSSNGASDGVAVVDSVIGGTFPVMFIWGPSTGNVTTSIATGLAAGVHCVTVIDVNGCDASDCVTIIEGSGIYGNTYRDNNQNCVQDGLETGLANRTLILNPGNIIIQTGSNGYWLIDSLPIGTYTLTADTSSSIWQLTCPVTQSFTVTNPDSSLQAPSFGYFSIYPCTAPNVNINAPFLRPGFSNQKVYVQACNTTTASGILNNAYTIIELPSLLTVNSGSMSYTNLGNNQYRVNLGNLSPGQCVYFWLSCTVSASATIGQTLCMNAELYPIDSCALDNIPNPYLGGVNPCTLPWDNSSLQVEVSCVNNDSVRFVIYNTGVLGGGDMDCFAPVRVYLDGQYILLDSIQLQGGDSIVFMFPGNGQTWRLEADQHPLHPGNSHPNATIENCGTGTWTPNLVNIFPMNDADPVIDIYCGLVTGSYDPNDKTGYPLGVGTSHDIQPNQDIEYVIRFQNTGTDTAFTVVIRDTLSMDYDVFSVLSGTSSHDYSFRMYGPRVLEWTFNNIMLPDSNVNQAGSNGFVTFKVKQKPNLPNGTVLENFASIYFDFNAPIFTNTSWHTVNRDFIFLNTDKQVVGNILPVKIYPNPTTGILHIDQGNNQEINITVLDNLGRILLQQYSNDVISSLNINHLPAGVYYITINNGKELVTQKVVKQ